MGACAVADDAVRLAVLVVLDVALNRGPVAAVDAAELPDVLGSLAGNDTILVIAQTAEDGERLEALINKLSNSRK